MEILALARVTPNLYVVTSKPPKCGQVEVKVLELPTTQEPPFKASLIRNKNGTALLNVEKIDLYDYLVNNFNHIIEGEVKNGILKGVACNRKIEVKTFTPIAGPVLALVPVKRIRKRPPPVAFSLIAYVFNLA